MGNETRVLEPSAILCADWGKELKKRAVYVADVSARVVRRVSANGWSVGAVLKEAERWASAGPVLATFDAPLGVPESYLRAVGRLPSWQGLPTFIEFLARAQSEAHFFDGTSVARDWKVERPFFAVPAGKGGRKSYEAAAAHHEVNLYRQIDKATHANMVFAKRGIPGSVGSAACALWQDLGPRLTTSRTFKVWPFEGDLDMLLGSTSIVVGEIYPRAAYATALLDAPAPSRPPLSVAKTDTRVRREAVETLLATKWARSLGVTFENLVEAEANEDDFDACMTAAALLRCVIEKIPLCPSVLDYARSEGGMLGTGSVNLELRQKTFGNACRVPDLVGSTPSASRLAKRERRKVKAAHVEDDTRTFPCRITGCDKVFHGSCGGWDGHVGAIRLHPNWHPELTSAEARKRQYKIEFPDFFR